MEMLSGLPVGLATCVGRERERAKVVGLVPDTRMVTLTGSGGCGKTRLVVEIAGDVAPRFPDGVCGVALQGGERLRDGRYGRCCGGGCAWTARERTLEASSDWSHELIDDGDVFDLVAGLVGKSLVQVTQRHARARYRLVETRRRRHAPERHGCSVATQPPRRVTPTGVVYGRGAYGEERRSQRRR